jgi:hypothetical protein
MLDLAHTGTTPLCRRKQAVADTLATRLQLDMTRWWSPTSDFFMGLTKAQISAAIMQSPAVLALSTDADRAEFEALLAGKKKDELADAGGAEGPTGQSKVRGTELREDDGCRV